MIKANIRGKNFIFDTKAGLFSKDKIDAGTLFLLDKIDIKPTDFVLDLGCGYGVIGVVTASTAKYVYMVDTDIRALKYSEINIKLNNIANAKIVPSDGFESIKNLKFDVILSNPPSHLPKEVITDFTKQSFEQLNPDGKIYFVTEKRIQPFIKREFEKHFGNYQLIANRGTYSISFTIKQ